MRILHVDKFLHPQGGAPVYMLDLAKRQRAAGHEVEFFAMTDERNQPATYSEHFAPHLELVPFPRRVPDQVRVLGAMIWSRPARRGIEATLREFRPDIVHVHNVYHQLSPSVLWAARAAGVPVVMTVHDAKLVCASYSLHDGTAPCDACIGHRTFAPAIRRRCRGGSLAASSALAVESTIHRLGRLYRPVHTFICPSEFIRSQYVRAGVFVDRLVHVPNFVELDAIDPASGAGTGVVFAGRLAEIKAVDVLIEAIGLIPEVVLDCYGDGPVRADLERLAERVAPGRVRFHGAVGRAEVDEAYRSARVAVLPSRVPENLPLAVLEAMAAGRPTIVTALGGAPELVDEGVTGRVVRPDDPRALATAIREFTDDPAHASAVGAAARRRAERFAPGPHLDAIWSVYDRAIGTPWEA